ncbi:sterol desaturase family protein [Flavobacterium caseinilyticum]|uniref:Fatty acid hydroxylase n=1 Tax=Flavobacterium caseinilyticum TaxID=2541732 RepID=A0A4R5AQ88_9FLAO|nr:sterol desaturase family protein [Flavobacterium caseinilyticum]TDD75228.1 fatty acid hydroxylase [Flavobacterium caseinilyticum]
MIPKNKTIPLFHNPLLEKYSRTNALIVIAILAFTALVLFTVSSIKVPLNIMNELIIFILGFLFFTLAEYLIHRFVFHSGEYTNTEKWQFKIHGIHHATPQDKERLALPLPLAVVLSGFFFFIYWIVMGQYSFFFFPGFLFGYASYLLVHYLIHTRRPPRNVFRYLWKHHHVHHHKNDNQAFGVTTPIWDIVFRTMPSPRRNKQP